MRQSEKNVAVARKLLGAIGGGEDPASIATMFAEDVAFDIPGDTGVLPWIGKYRGRSAVVTFLTGLREHATPVKFEIQDVLASESRAVILVDLETKLKVTGKTIASEAAIVLEIEGEEIRRFLMIEDSFAVSREARP